MSPCFQYLNAPALHREVVNSIFVEIVRRDAEFAREVGHIFADDFEDVDLRNPLFVYAFPLVTHPERDRPRKVVLGIVFQVTSAGYVTWPSDTSNFRSRRRGRRLHVWLFIWP